MDERSSQSQPTDLGVPLDPDDEGIGNVRPDEAEPLGPDDEGIGNVDQ